MVVDWLREHCAIDYRVNVGFLVSEKGYIRNCFFYKQWANHLGDLGFLESHQIMIPSGLCF